MNYFGKFDAKVSDALGQHPGAHHYSETVHAAHVPSDAIVVPDAHLLFGGEFKRAGVDLVLSGDGREFVVHDYFKGGKHAALASPDGAHLTGDIVNALAGEIQVAQAAGAPAGGQVIGHVTKLVGTATAIRNGVSIILNNGDNVEKGDVVASGSDSTLGITFIDGTVFGLSSNARMVLNEMVYDPNGSNNSSLLSLVAGTITFVAGETAKHGDMKVDTPVATMGIRGTAVLVEIDFAVPPQSADPNLPPTPNAKFQVLVEPDGTTGSYILFDKTTLTPLAVVDKAGTQINITNGLMSQTTSPLSPEIQKLITDVFSLKFSDSSTTKSIEHFTDSIIPTPFGFAKFSLYNGPLPTFVFANLLPATAPPPPPNGANNSHIAEAPFFTGIEDGKTAELPLTTGSSTPDKVTGSLNYFDVNVHDNATVSVSFASFNYKDAHGNDITKSLNALELADIKAVSDIADIKNLLTITQGGLDNVGNGTASYTYKVADGAFDFLAAGETLTLTFNATVDNNYAPADQTGSQTFTITITGSNDVPVITSPQQNITFAPAGHDTSGGNLFPNTATHGTLAFTDPDLTDTHTPSVEMTSALLNGTPLSEIVGADRYKAFADAVTVKITTADDSTGTGTGQIEWTLADLEVYLADLVPDGEKLILTYTVTVTDSQGATSTQDIVVTIEGNKSAVTAWIDTNPIPDGGAALWSDAANWESDKAPTAADDVFIGNDQVNPKTATFPVTVDADAQAKSLSMNEFSDGNGIPTLNVEKNVTLAISGALNLNTSTATDPSTGNPLVLATAEAIINNFGTITVGDIAELLKSSVLNNNGTLVLSGGGDFKDQTSVTNAGKIEIADSSTFNVAVDVHNAGGNLQIDQGSTLKILDGVDSSGHAVGVTVSGGKVTIAGGGTLDIESGKGATLDNVEVDGANAASPVAASIIEVGLSTPSLLVLDDGTKINDGALKILGGSTLDVESAGGATLNDVSVIGVSGDTPSAIKVGGGSTLVLEGGTIVTDGNMSIAKTGVLEISGTNGGTLGDVAVENLGTIQVDSAGAVPTLVLEAGTSITDGKMAVNGVVEIGAGGATLDNVIVTNSSLIQVDGPPSPTPTTVTLVLDGGTKIIGGELLIHDQSSTDEGVVEVGTGGATFDNLTVVNNNLLTVDPSVILTLDDDTAVVGGQLALGAGSTLDVEAGPTGSGATLDGVTVNGTNPAALALASTIEVGVTGAATLLVDDDTTIINGNLTIAAASTLDVEAGFTGAGATLDGVAVSGAGGDNPSTIEVGISGAATLLFDDDTTITNGDLLIVGGSTLDVEAGATGSGATLDGVTVVGTDAVDLIPASTIAVGNSGAATLTLDDGTTITHGDLTIAKGSTLDIESSKGAALDGVTVTNDGTIQVDGPVASPEVVNLVLDGGTKITGGKLLINPLQNGAEGTVEIGAGDATFDDVTVTNNILTIDPTDTLTIDDGTVISGGTIDDAGTLKVTSASEIKNATVDGGGNVTVTGDTLTLSEVTLDGVTLAGSFTNADTLTVDGVVTLDNAAISGGTIDDKGTLFGHGSIGSVITDTGAVTADGGTLTLSGLNTYSGATTINSGAGLAAGVAGALSASSAVTDNGELDLGTNNQSIAALNGTNAAALVGSFSGSGKGPAVLTIGNGGSFAGVIEDGTAGAATALTLTAGTLTLSGANTYTGLTTINGGTLALKGSGSIADSSDVIDDATFDISATTSGASIVTLSGNGTVKLGSKTLTLSNASTTFSGAIGGTGGLTLLAGLLTLTGDNSYSGTTTISGTLELSGSGSIADSSNVVDHGTFDISGTTSGASIVTLSGEGTVKLGSKTLTLSNASTTFSGAIGGTGGLTLTTGTETLTGNNGYSGLTTINGGTLALSGTGSIASSSNVIDHGTFDISATNSGASIVTLSGDGTVKLGSKTLTLSDASTTFSGTIGGTGGLTLTSGTETLTGNNGYSGLTTINGGTLALSDTGSIASSSNVIDHGTFDISTTTSGASIVTLSGDGAVKLGAKTLTLSNASTTFSGIISGNGGLTVDGSGTETLSGINTYTGATTIGSGETLALSGTGSIAASSGVADSGTFDISGTSGASIKTLSGTGALTLGAETLTLTNASTTFSGTISSTGGGITVASGTLTLGTMTLDDLTLAGSFSNSGTLTIDDTVTFNGVTISGGTLDISGILDSEGTSTISGATIVNANHIDVVSGTLTIDPTPFTNNGTFEVQSSAIFSGEVVTDPHGHTSVLQEVVDNTNGVIQIDKGGMLTLFDTTINGGTIIDNGTLLLTGTTSKLENVTFTGAATLDIAGHSTLEIGGSIASGVTVNFQNSSGHSELILDNPSDFHGVVEGLVEPSTGTESDENYIDLVGFTNNSEHHARVLSAVYDSHTGITAVTLTSGTSQPNLTIDLEGNYSHGGLEFASDGNGGTLLSDPTVGSGAVTIDSGVTLDIAGASTAAITFTNTAGNTGELVLADSKDFTGSITGFAGDGTVANSDLIDVADVNFANVATDKTTYTENAAGTGGTLTLYDAQGQAIDSINFNGDYQLANFTIEDDGSGGTLIVDPPVSTATSSGTVVATAANQTLGGSAPSDNFVFNFAGVGHSTIADFHPATDTIQFASAIFANAQAALNAVRDDGHGNSILTIDAHDSITLTGVQKAQLSVHDFHSV